MNFPWDQSKCMTHSTSLIKYQQKQIEDKHMFKWYIVVIRRICLKVSYVKYMRRKNVTAYTKECILLNNATDEINKIYLDWLKCV